MLDLHEEGRSLAARPARGPLATEEIAGRAAARRRRRRTRLAGLVLAVAVLVAAGGALRAEGDAPVVVATLDDGPEPTNGAGPGREPTVTVSRSQDLNDGTVVEVHADGLAAESTASFAVCSADDESTCDYWRYGRPGADVGRSGRVAFSMPLARRMLTATGWADCSTGAGGCALVVHGDEGVVVASVPLTFAGPPLDDPVLRVEPSTGLREGQAVTVRGEGFGPGQDVALDQCLSRVDDDPVCINPSIETMAADRDGAFEQTLVPLQAVVRLDGAPIECGADESQCWLAFYPQIGYPAFAEAPISFGVG